MKLKKNIYLYKHISIERCIFLSRGIMKSNIILAYLPLVVELLII